MTTIFQITLKAARVNVGLSQQEAATILGVDKATLSRWEKGTSMPKASQINSICSLYGVTYDMLIFLPEKLAFSQTRNGTSIPEVVQTA